MIIISGAKRSGTSMWMQILRAAGFPTIGEKFPNNWADTIVSANPNGFYESRLTAGIFYRTNPNPNTGAYLFPDACHAHAVKVFAPGLVRTGVAFIDRVIVTVKPWRQVSCSLRRLRALSLSSVGLDDSRSGIDFMPPVLEWWSDNFSIIRDVATRRYPVNFQSYDSLLTAPEAVLTKVFEWIGHGAVTKAVDAIDLRLSTSYTQPRLDEEDCAEIPQWCIECMDLLYSTIHEARPITPNFILDLNRVNEVILPIIIRHHDRREDAKQRLAST